MPSVPILFCTAGIQTYSQVGLAREKGTLKDFKHRRGTKFPKRSPEGPGPSTGKAFKSNFSESWASRMKRWKLLTSFVEKCKQKQLELKLIIFKELNCLFKIESDSNRGFYLLLWEPYRKKGEADVSTVHRRKPSNPVCFSVNQLTLWWLVQWVVKSLYNILGWVKILSVKIAYHKIPIRLLEGSCYWRHQCPQLTKFEN